MDTIKISSDSISKVSSQSNLSDNKTNLIDDVGNSFEDVIQSLTESQNKSDDLLTGIAAGEDIDIHDAMIALQENDVNFRVAMAIRNKLIDAYHEIIRMTV